MKVPSLSRWLQGAPLPLKSILLYGSNLEVISFRQQLLQRIYKNHQYIQVNSWLEVVHHLKNTGDLFSSSVIPHFIHLPSVTDSVVKEEELNNLLANSPHFLLLESSKLTSKSRIVLSFQQASDRAVIPCYVFDPDEITTTLKWYMAQIGLMLEMPAQHKLYIYMQSHREEFFSILEMLSLYANQTSLSEAELTEALGDIYSLPAENLSTPFFLKDSQALYSYIEATEESEWVGLIRVLLQDVMTLMGLSLYKVSSSALKESWMKGPVKFPYGRVSLYQSILSKDWSLERGGKLLAGLLGIEAGLKSSPSVSRVEFQHKLLELSMGR